MSNAEFVEQYIRSIAKNNPSIFTEELVQQAIEKFKYDTDDISVIKDKIDILSSKFIERKNEEQIYLESMQQKFNNSEYINTSIQNLDISTLSYEQMENLFFHYSWKKYLESYDKEGMKPVIGENSEGIDPKASIFFSKGVEGVLELWDVWLKWRLNRQNNPQFSGTTQDEIQATNNRFRTGQITDEERKKWYYWMDYFKSKKYLENPLMLEKLYEYQFTEMINSDYLILDLKEQEDFSYEQVDIKKQWAIEKAKATGRGIDPLTATQYGHYSDFSSPMVDKWNMQTIPGKNITIEPSRIRRLTIDGKTDVFSIMKYMYDKYQLEVPKEKQVKFDVLDNYIKYVTEKKQKLDTLNSTEKEKFQQIKDRNLDGSVTPNTSQYRTIRGPEVKSAKFSKRPQNLEREKDKIEKENPYNEKINIEKQSKHKEIVQTAQDHKQIKHKNNKAKTLINNGNQGNKGFTDVFILSLIVSFVAGALFMIVYFIAK